jgi:outer membrane protein assembly factor BamA
MWPDVGSGTHSEYPSIETIYSDATAPGLTEQPRYLQSTISAEIDYRDERGRPRRGGYYRATMGFWNDRTFERYDFKRFDVNVAQFIPLDANKKHILLGRVGLAAVNNSVGSRIPFYFLPYVGGMDTIRSFHEFRFRDENALWMTAEYDWMVIPWVSVATFFDAGKVAHAWHEVGLSDLKHGFGFGARVHSTRQILARVDAAVGGDEGWRVFLRLGPTF